MNFIFQKKDKMKIENYRPITLLETITKSKPKQWQTSWIEFAKTVNLIHKDQAGFVPNRSLFDHTRPAHLVVDYTEKQNKMAVYSIINLDQETAYNKIDNEYLWEILGEFRFPK